MEDVLMKFGIKTGHVITGLLASGIGLIFNKRVHTLREKIRGYFVVICGSILTGYITPLILLKWKWLDSAEYSVAFVFGLFGMGIVESIFLLISKLKENPIQVGKAIRDIFKR